MTHALNSAVNLRFRASECTCTVKMNRFNEILQAHTTPGYLFGVYEYTARCQHIQDTTVKTTFFGIAKMVYGQRRHDGIVWPSRQIST